jgi:hypothetical protein
VQGTPAQKFNFILPVMGNWRGAMGDRWQPTQSLIGSIGFVGWIG